ncbi:MAG: response regulator [Thermodesulfobacteriota bacterium]|nr:response regulator [Thermodesulfobacteriota bacterium]
MYSSTVAFRAESTDLFEKIDILLVEIEKNPDNLELAREIYHAVNTVKGLGALFGLPEIGDIFQGLENVFDLVLKGEAAVTEKLTGLALTAMDHAAQIIFETDTPIDQDMLKETSKQINADLDSFISKQSIKKEESEARVKPPRILLIDDEIINRTLLKECIFNYRQDIEVIAVDSAEEGLYYYFADYFTDHFDLVLLDIMMPVIDGNHFIAIIEKNRQLGHITTPPNIVVQTAIQSMGELLSFTRKKCVQEVIKKPISTDRIIECVDRYCPVVPIK